MHVFDCQGKDVAVLRWIRKSGPFAAGVLTPLLPCAMLSPVHIFAAGTGSAWRGALCMATFILGTTPALFLFGSSNALLTTYARKVTVKISGAVPCFLEPNCYSKQLGPLFDVRGLAVAVLYYRSLADCKVRGKS